VASDAREFDIEWGPVFANIVLADEINRAPAKVQSALLEVMAERQVSIAGTTRALPAPFLTLATENPIESEGVYALPEAQRDRFLMQIIVHQPSYAEEVEIAKRMGVRAPVPTQVLTSTK
jgi:MoxR-like ATPase